MTYQGYIIFFLKFFECIWWFLFTSWVVIESFFVGPSLFNTIYFSGCPTDISKIGCKTPWIFLWLVLDIFCNLIAIWSCYDGFSVIPGLGYAIFIICLLVFTSPDLPQTSKMSCKTLWKLFHDLSWIYSVILQSFEVATMVFLWSLGSDMPFLSFAPWSLRLRTSSRHLKCLVRPPENFFMTCPGYIQ